MYLPATYNQAKQEINASTSEGLDDVWVDFDFDRLSDFDEEEETENAVVGKMPSMSSLTGQEIKFGMREIDCFKNEFLTQRQRSFAK